MNLNRILASRRIPPGARNWLASQRRQLKLITRRLSKPSTIPLLITLVALPVLGIVNVFNAHAQPGTMVAAGVTLPNSPVWLNGALGGHWWVSDGANGFCRLDPDPANAGQLVENVATCDLTAAAAAQVAVGPVFTNPDSSQHRFVYIADSGSKSFGPVRVRFDLATETIAAGSGVIMGAQNAAVPTCDDTFCTAGKGSFRSNAVALGPAGELYVAFIRSTNIVRIANAAGASIATQTTTVVGKINFPRPLGATSLAMFFHAPDATHTTAWGDLYIAELTGSGVSMITDVGTCGACATTINPNITSFSPFGMVADGGVGDDGTIQPSTHLFVGEAPVDGPSSVLRYDPVNNIQDLYTSTVPAFTSPFDGLSVTNYLSITGLGLRQDTGELFVGDDPTVNALNPPVGMGHLWSVAAGGALDCAGTPIAPCAPLAAPATIMADLYAWGMQAPAGGIVLQGANGERHLWVSGEGGGLCRLDIVPNTSLHATEFASCDDGTMGAVAQPVLDPTPNSDGTSFVYVADVGRFSQGVWRITFDPNGDNGIGSIANPTLLAPTSNLGPLRPLAAAVGPDGALYFAGPKADAGATIKKIANPRGDPRTQTVVGVANPSDGGGVAGDFAFLGPDLYVPEGAGFSVVRNIAACTSTAICTASILPIGTPGGTPASAVATDAVRGVVYGLASAGPGPATLFQFDPISQTSRVYVTQGRAPAAGSPEATVYCATQCIRPPDPTMILGGTYTFPNAFGLGLDEESGTVFMMDDPQDGNRFGTGHVWSVEFRPMPPAPPAPTPTPLPTPPPAPTTQTCTVTVNVPSLASGNSYWVQFTTHSAGTISASWTIPVAQQAQLLLYTGNPFAGLADPIKKGPTGKPIAVQNTSNTQNFTVSVANQAAGTYTVQFFNGSNVFVATTGTLTYTNDSASACPVSPTSQNILN